MRITHLSGDFIYRLWHRQTDKQYLQIHMDTGPEFKQQEAECDIAHDQTGC